MKSREERLWAGCPLQSRVAPCPILSLSLSWRVGRSLRDFWQPPWRDSLLHWAVLTGLWEMLLACYPLPAFHGHGAAAAARQGPPKALASPLQPACPVQSGRLTLRGLEDGRPVAPEGAA